GLRALIAFGGSGYFSFEVWHVASRAGARVTILHRDDRPLAEFDAGLVERLVARTRALGVDVRLNTDVRAIQANDDEYRIVADARGSSSVVDARLVVHGAGRVPDLDHPALDAGGAGRSAPGLPLN